MSWSFDWDEEENVYETTLRNTGNRLKARLRHLEEILDSFVRDGYGLDELNLRLGGEEGGVKLDYEITGDPIFMKIQKLLHRIVVNNNTLKASHPNWKSICDSKCLLEWARVNRRELSELTSLIEQA